MVVVVVVVLVVVVVVVVVVVFVAVVVVVVVEVVWCWCWCCCCCCCCSVPRAAVIMGHQQRQFLMVSKCWVYDIMHGTQTLHAENKKHSLKVAESQTSQKLSLRQSFSGCSARKSYIMSNEVGLQQGAFCLTSIIVRLHLLVPCQFYACPSCPEQTGLRFELCVPCATQLTERQLLRLSSHSRCWKRRSLSVLVHCFRRSGHPPAGDDALSPLQANSGIARGEGGWLGRHLLS